MENLYESDYYQWVQQQKKASCLLKHFLKVVHGHLSK